MVQCTAVRCAQCGGVNFCVHVLCVAHCVRDVVEYGASQKVRRIVECRECGELKALGEKCKVFEYEGGSRII